MTTAEQQLSRLLGAAAPDGQAVDVDDVASTVRRRRRVRETGVAVATVLAAVATVVGIAVVTPRSPAAPAPPAVDLTDAVPWSDAPATTYQPPDGSAAVGARPCTASDVTATEGDGGAATGHLLTVIAFTNASETACVLDGYPALTVTEPGRPDVSATDGSWFPTGGSAVMKPGDRTMLGVQTDTTCAADPDGTAPPDPYHHLVVALPGGGDVGVEVAGGIDVTCGVMLTPFYVGEVGDAGPADPLGELRATLDVPETFAPGEPLVYVVRLTNPTDTAIALDRCPSYLETLTGPTTYQESHALACTAAGGEIGPHRTVAFEMRLAVPEDAQTWLALSSHQPPSWPVTVAWSLVAPFDVSATATLTLVGAAGTDAPATTATATGVLELMGGPATTDGTLSLDVPPGTYTIAGTPTDWSTPCTQGNPVDIPAEGASGIDVICSIP